MKCAHWAFFLLSGFFLCCCDSTKPKTEEEYGLAGPDLTCHIGEYVTLGRGTTIHTYQDKHVTSYKWEQAPDNPSQVIYYVTQPDSLYLFATLLAGEYKFKLTITTDSSTSYFDEALVTVLPRKHSLFEDPVLELQIRKTLNKGTGSLSASEVQSIDSLRMRLFVGKLQCLKGIDECTNLTYLTLARQNIEDISPIVSLTDLEYLNLSQNNISNITVLSKLKKLKVLFIFDNEIADISPLSDLINLELAHLLWNPIQSLASLSTCINLKDIAISEAITSDLSPLVSLINLKSLYVTYCNIENLPSFSSLSKLYNLNLSNNNISDISEIANLKALKTLKIGNNNIHNISALSDLGLLDMVALSSNTIEDIAALVNNQGINSGDVVDLIANPLNHTSIDEYINVLKNRGVLVTW